jgi:hypothetical protein
MIESITFGKLLFKGKVSRSDTIVYPDHMDTRWWLKDKTCIGPEDLTDVLEAAPEVVTVGLGFMMPISISEDAVKLMGQNGITVFVGKAEEAAEAFNTHAGTKKTIGLFHLL